MTALRDATETLTGEITPSREGGASSLCLLLDAAHPAEGGARWALEGVETVLVGRGEGRSARFDRASSTLSLGFADARMSSRHARLVRLAGGFAIEDLDSKNGTRVDGARVKRARLGPRSVVEMGGTFLALVDATREERALTQGLSTAGAVLGATYERLAAVARSDVAVLVLGESGTGKELVARAVHARSGRRGAFVAVNCAALPATLIESELFGHRRGAFSGATDDRPGLLRAADRGTLFLDEIGDLPLAAQAALLRAIQEREVTPVGETQPVRVDLRVVSATHRDLDRSVAEGRFRLDLLARLDGHRAHLPPLRERPADLASLVASLLHRLAPAYAGEVAFGVAAARALVSHDWPRNVRELEQALAAALATASGRTIELDDLPNLTRVVRGGDEPVRVTSLSPEDAALRDRLVALLEAHRGNLAGVARAMAKDRTQIRRWLARLGLDVDHFR